MEIVDYLLARKKAGGGGSDVTIEQLSVTENGTYSEQGIAYSPVVVNVPAPENSYQLTDIPTGTVSTIEDGTDLPMSSLKVGIEPVQDLHGYDHPWAGGAGKNLFHIDAEYTSGYETYMYELYAKPNTAYTLSSNCPYSSPANLYFNGDSTETNGVGLNYPKTFNSDEDGKLIIYVRYKANSASINLYTAVKNGQYYIQLEEGSTATTFEPYSNICPISGWTAANVTRSGKNLYFDKLENASISAIGTLENNPSNDMLIARVNEGETYTFTLNDTGVTVGGFFVEKPTMSSISYNNARIYLSSASQYSYTIPQGVKYIAVRYLKTFTAPIIEKGATITTYEPYNGTTYTIQFRDGDNPLTVYGGTLDVTTGELVVDRALLYADGSFNVFNILYNSNSQLYCTIVKSNLGAPANNPLPKSDKFRPYAAVGIGNCYITNYGNYLMAILPDQSADTVAKATQWFEDNPTQFVYELATPTTYHLTPAQVRTLVGTNNIWADTGDVLSGKYFKEL